MKFISSSYTKYRAVAFNVKENPNEIRFFAFVRENQPIRIEYSFSNTVCWKSTNQNSAFLKVNCLIFLTNLNYYLKIVNQKTFELPRVTL